MRGAKPPAIIFVWPSPTRVGAAEDEVMGGDDLLGQRKGPRLPDSFPRRYLHQRCFFTDLVVKETFI